ncbi:ShlB/FhaC/HecB family hemolysin secretion/activation protein [Collimonas sp. PA-H2]|uniref:ShlB/FhaC/HecB family hemolysin secretion/activation protein n=1 Tax=Collimonas sp. PA-H2 TaxID=1881062 RepID=UPI001304268A|nr:ShlB/FhaC/HecB family hemolysin secretion/activation protein [Collimonas sp. PA-H2]
MLAVFALPAAYAADPPNAGSILQQVQQPKLPSPSATGTGLIIDQDRHTSLPTSAPISVQEIQIVGNTLFDTATLHALVAEAEGKSVTLPRLGEYATRITDYYHLRGYPLARAVIPVQSIRAGLVRMQVIEANYGKITLDNRSRAGDALLQKTLSPLQAGRAVTQAGLDRTLLLASDIPGVAVSAILKPGEEVGTSDLQVQTDPTVQVVGNVTADNFGNRYTGQARFGVAVNVFNPLRHGDVLSIGALSSGRDMNYGSISYETLLNGLGTRMGGSYSALHYILGDSLGALDARGTAQVASSWVKHPFIRTRDANLYGQLQYDRKQLDDRIGASSIKTDRHLNNLSASLNGDWRNGMLAGGIDTWSIGLTAGRVGFDDRAAQLADAATAKTQGGFTKWNGNFAHLQNLNQNDSLYLALFGQWSNGNLDSAEKMVAGGPYTVRAYDIGVLSGDTGVFGSVELRHDLGQFASGCWQVLAFVDSEHVRVNKNPWLPGDNGATLSGAGFGMTWSGPDQWHAKLYIAIPFDSTPQLIGDNKSVRAWAEIGKAF